MRSRAERRAYFFDLVRRVGSQPGELDARVREALVRGAHEAVPAPLAALAERIRGGAAQVTDEDLEAVRRAGYNDDQLFELTVATAQGESARRYRKTLALLGRPTHEG